MLIFSRTQSAFSQNKKEQVDIWEPKLLLEVVRYRCQCLLLFVYNYLVSPLQNAKWININVNIAKLLRELINKHR